MARPNLRFLIPLTAVALLGAGGWYIERQRARERSSLSGFFESQPIEVSSRIGGRVESIKVREGDHVSAGDLLVVLEAGPSVEETAAKEAQAEQARAAGAEVLNGPRPEEIRRQEAVVAEQRANLARLRNGSLPEEIASARDRLDEAQAQLHKTLAGPRPQEIEAARASEQAARARLAQSERGLTAEEKAQAHARYDAAAAAESIAAIEMNRTQVLVREGADAPQHLDRARSDLETARARTREMREAMARADAGTPPEELEQARESYRQARANLDLLLAGSRKEDIAAARYEADAARENLVLVRRGPRHEDIEAAEAKLRQAEAQLAQLRAGSRREQIAASRAATAAAEALARSSRDSLRERQVRAPRDCTIERRLVTAGDLVQANAPLLRVTDDNDIWIRVYVPEANLAHVSAGTYGTLRVDGIGADLPVLVESIDTRGEFTPANLQTPDERGKQVFAVRLRLTKPDGRVKSGMFASVRRLGELQW